MVVNVGAIEEGGEEGHLGGQEAYRTEQGCQGKAVDDCGGRPLTLQRIGGLERRF